MHPFRHTHRKQSVLMQFTLPMLIAALLSSAVSGCSLTGPASKPVLSEQPATQSVKTDIFEEDTSNTSGTSDETTQNSNGRAKFDTASDAGYDATWFAGSVGDYPIHAKLDYSDAGKKVNGFYYYDKYKKNIELTGSAEEFLANNKTLSLTENTAEKAEIICLARSADYFQGFWRSKDKVLPFYLIRCNTKNALPQKQGAAARKLEGKWYGCKRSYHADSNGEITVLFDDLLYFSLFAENGAHSGELESFAIIRNGEAEAVFSEHEEYSNENSEHIKFVFSIKNGNLILDSNRYDYYCGMNVFFDSEYTHEERIVPVPTAQDVGIVNTPEQAALFKKLVGDNYESFIQMTSFVNYEATSLDGKTVQAGSSMLLGLPAACYYIVSDNYIYAAINNYDEGIDYYTNDPKYANTLPKPMEEWASDHSDPAGSQKKKINYHYVK